MTTTTALDLRPYQRTVIDDLRVGLRDGHLRQILCAPTGSGKTEMAIYLIQEALAKGSRVLFVADRRVLVSQTAQRLAGYGIPHGVYMAGDSYGRYQPVQVASAQTLKRRDTWPACDILIIDEAHTEHQAITKFAREWDGPTIGLTATPLTEHLAKTYSRISNATTTNELLKDGWLAPLKVFQARATIDMTGAAKQGGEWTSEEVRTRSRPIIGDIVTEWERLTREHFGGPVKTLLFSADTAHGAELCEAFQNAGYDFRQSTYRDSSDATESIVEDFKAGEFVGLVSVEKFVKGFDVPDVLCLVGARPYSSSLSSVIQQMGRGMRTSPGKVFCLYLDFCENVESWWEDVADVWEFGVSRLPQARDTKPERREGRARADVRCPQCGYVSDAGGPCLSCGYQRRRRSKVETVSGYMEQLVEAGSRRWRENKRWTWANVCLLALERRYGDETAALKTARGYYHSVYNEWPPWGWTLRPAQGQPDPRVVRSVRRGIQRWRSGRG